MSSKLEGSPETMTVTIHEEEDLPHPPVLLLYSLDGKISMYHSFYVPWKEKDILREPQKVPARKAIV